MTDITPSANINKSFVRTDIGYVSFGWPVSISDFQIEYIIHLRFQHVIRTALVKTIFIFISLSNILALETIWIFMAGRTSLLYDSPATRARRGFFLRITNLRTRVGRNSAERSVKQLIFEHGRHVYIIIISGSVQYTNTVTLSLDSVRSWLSTKPTLACSSLHVSSGLHAKRTLIVIVFCWGTVW